MKEHLIIIHKMKTTNKIMILVLFLFMVTLVSAGYKTVYNPFTSKLDYVTNGNFSGDNITADYFNGDGSLLTGISGGIWINDSDTATYNNPVLINNTDFGIWIPNSTDIYIGDFSLI